VPCAAYHLVDFAAPDPEVEADRFAALLQERPIDMLCQGIGTSGHLALNEPDDSDFDDPRWVRVVRLVEQSKRQLGDDPNFRDLGYIPDHGITMTIPAMMSAESIYTIVPLALKKPILTRLEQIETPTMSLPASIILDTPVLCSSTGIPVLTRGSRRHNGSACVAREPLA
jgi:glucosamine-6-phosphate deaminase